MGKSGLGPWVAGQMQVAGGEVGSESAQVRQEGGCADSTQAG